MDDHPQQQLSLTSNVDNSSGRLKSRLANHVLLVFSLLLNPLFVALLTVFPIHSSLHQELHRDARAAEGVGDNNLQALTWSRRAAEEAEAAAAYHCSGHGFVYVDTLNIAPDGQGKTSDCECNECYTGPDCSQTVVDCAVDVDSGDPLFLEPFWIKNAEASATVVPAWYRMSYSILDGPTVVISPELETQIRGIHALVGNAVTVGRYIVIGTGSTQLINAAVYSLSHKQDARYPAKVVAPAPYYGAYRTQTEMFYSVNSMWNGDANGWANRSNKSTRFVQIVASPDNPTGFIQRGALKGEDVRNVYDHAYYWPHYTAITEPADEDVMLFTLSKLSGHGGSRLGWAIVKDYDVYEKMAEYVLENTFGVSHDTQLRASRILKTVIAGYGPQENSQQRKLEERKIYDEQKHHNLLFHYAYDVMQERWQRLQKIFSRSNRFSLQNLTANHCSFFSTTTGPSPAYAWVKCERDEDEDCTAVFRSGGIIGRAGELFGGENQYVRLSLIKRHDNFALLERRLQQLVFYGHPCVYC
eukprot:PITA_01902